MSNKHYTVKNTMGGCFCKKCLEWSNMPDGLKGRECFATRKEARANAKLLKQSGTLIVRDEDNLFAQIIK
jgi:hypothetical protein